MKHTTKLIIAAIVFAIAYSTYGAGVFQIDGNALNEVNNSSMQINDGGGDLQRLIEQLSIGILGTIKTILSALIIVFLVYAGANMVLAMGGDEDKLSSSRNQIWYSAIGLLFINIPGTLYDVFYSRGGEINEIQMSNTDFNAEAGTGNLFINDGFFQNVFYDQIVRFLQIAIFGLAILVIVMAGYRIITARGRDEKVSDAKLKIIYSVIALFFVGFIEVLKNVVYNARLDEAAGLFSSISNLLLLFAVPITMFFLFLAAFYYITSNGDEEKVKKAKTIVLNTFLATLLLMALYTFLLDLVQL